MNAGGPAVQLPTERVIQRAILKMAGLCYPRVFIFHPPNGAHLAGNQTARFKQIGALKGDGFKAGIPDLVCLWAPAKIAMIEVKRPKTGRISDEQKLIHGRLDELRVPYAVVTSVQEAYEFLFEQGAPRERSLS